MPRDKESLFITQREVDYANDIVSEFLEDVICQKIVYYAIEEQTTKTDELYGESTKKGFRDPVEIYCRVFLADHRMTVGEMGAENIFEIEIYFQRDRVMRDLGFYPRVGDFCIWNEKVFEIKTVREPQLFGGLSQHRVGILCKAIVSRQEVFSLSKDRPYDQTIVPDSNIRSQ